MYVVKYQSRGVIDFDDARMLMEKRQAQTIRATCHAANDLFFEICTKHHDFNRFVKVEKRI